MSDFESAWPAADRVPALRADEIHVWLVSLAAQDEFQLYALRQWLTPPEQERADRFLFDRHRHRFVVGRARLRQLLGLYLGKAPLDIDFQYDGLGKPSFRGSAPGNGLCFNFSNSDQAALLAVADDVELGVDIERLRPLTNLEGLAKRFFTATETEQILATQGAAQQATFFRCWTRKEAYLKAVGKGLTYPLNKVLVTVGEEEPARIVSIDGNEAAADPWRIEHLQPAAGYFGAVARSGSHSQITQLRWDG
jgi:4'-phosphopantetheinyl transferase